MSATSWRGPAGQVRLIAEPVAPAQKCIGTLERGGRIVGLTKGQFSLLDLIRAVLAQTGPADVRLSTWSIGIRDAETAAWLLRGEDIRSLQLLVDRSFPGRQPQYAGRVVALFGADALVVTRVHAKVALIAAGDWKIAISSSMNLNRNPRFEQFDLVDSAEVHGFYAAWFDEMAVSSPHGLKFDEHDAEQAFTRALNGGATDAEVLAEMQGKPIGTTKPQATWADALRAADKMR